MNLVSYEYIATQQKRHGVMVLSEFTGAAQSLNGSIIVNPWNTEELAGAIHDAVTMGEEQRSVNYHKLERYVMKYTRCVEEKTAHSSLYLETLFAYAVANRVLYSSFWGQSFVGELNKISE
jgi:trehalose-6-phosphate synthase